MLKYTLVPESFFDKDKAYDILSQAVQLEDNDNVTYQELPEYKAVLVYVQPVSGDNVIARIIHSLPSLADYNKLAVAYEDDVINIGLATGSDLKIVNSYNAPDIVTAEYFILAVLKRFQVNPKVTVLYHFGNLPFKLQNDLFKYFKGVEKI